MVLNGSYCLNVSKLGAVTVCIMCSRFHILICLMLSTLGKIFSRRHTEIFFLFFPEMGFAISCKLSPLETVCMKCQILFSGKK